MIRMIDVKPAVQTAKATAEMLDAGSSRLGGSGVVDRVMGILSKINR